MRPTCYRCLKPRALCLCGRIEPVANRTEVVILQHPKERTHPFGTVRIARLGLEKVRVEIPYSPFADSLYHPIDLGPRSALLYPHPDAQPLETAAPGSIEQLVVLDGTWSHARRLYRDNPWLQSLPHVSLTPERPSEYRIRKEPDPRFVSTIEAIAAGLQLIEPETAGIEGLLDAFRSLIDDQIATRSSAVSAPRRMRARARPFLAVPEPLVHLPLDRLAVVYGEFHPQLTPQAPQPRSLLQWTAQRLDGTPPFAALVRQPEDPSWPSADYLAKLDLEAAAVARTAATGRTDFVARWRAFAQPETVLMAWTRSALELLARTLPEHATSPAAWVILKTAYTNVTNRASGTLEETMLREGIEAEAAAIPGRAATRLANGIAIARWLRERAHERIAAAGPTP